jgi:serine/threonine protein kinase
MSIAPRRLGKYELQERLGRGGMAEVWKALDTQLHRYVAIKLLQANLQADPNFVNRFTHEAQTIAALRHPNIVQIYDFYTAEGHKEDGSEAEAIAYMVMEYIQGSTLADYVNDTSRKGQIPPVADIIRLFTPISLAIDYAHQQGMIHRDIKPANILLDKRNTARNPMGEPILSDFGLAKVLNVASQTMTGAVMGTPLYISPEQVQNRPVSPQTDLYALGVVLYEIFTGVPPFRGESLTGIMMQHLTTTPAEPHKINPNLPPALSKVILKSLAKNPLERYASASAMLVDVAEAFNLAMPGESKHDLPPGGARRSQDQMQTSKPDVGKTSPSSFEETIRSAEGAVNEVFPVSTDAPTILSQYYAPGTIPVAKVGHQDIPVSPLDSAGNLQGQVNSDADLAGKNPSLVDKQLMAPGQTLPGAARPAPAGGYGVTPLPPSLEPAPIVSQPSPPAPPKRGRIRLILAILLVCVVVGSGLGAFFLFNHHSPTTPIVANTTVGQAFFVSSGKRNETTNQGSNDELQIDLHNISNPPSGTAYYAWLLPDQSQSEAAPFFLGQLAVNNGTVHFLYKSNSDHTNLMATNSRFLITEENAGVTPLVPSPDLSKWRYFAEIPQTPAAGQTYSMVDHLRHLLAKDPELEPNHLPGGLSIWAYRNIQKVMTFAVGAQKDWHAQNFATVRQQIIGILDYLDGSKYVNQDVPAGTPITANPRFAQIGLLQLHAQQNLPGYLYHIELHLNGVLSSPGATQYQHTTAAQIDTGITTMQRWLEQVRSDAVKLLQMDDAHLALSSSLPLLNDMATQATNAFMGRNNPSTGKPEQGFSQIYVEIQHMAIFEVKPYK